MTVSCDIGPANARASRRGNTGGPSVIPRDWAYRVRRRYNEVFFPEIK